MKIDFGKMSLREKVLQTFVVTIREINRHGGPEKFFKDYPVGGMYYGNGAMFVDDNGLEIGTQLTLEKLNECKKYSNLPLLVCADEAQLKGQVENMGCGPILSSRSEEDSYDYGKIIGMQMNEHGVDWVLGPAIDMPIIPFKAFGGGVDDPEVAKLVYKNVVDGIQHQGVCATVKHFPGLGSGVVNMHFAPGKNTLEFDKWMDTYGALYKKMFEHNVMSVMTTHITLRSYDNETHDGFYPIATYSQKLTTDLLKGELGFKGAVVTDALIMGGMATGNLIAETCQAFKAGADLLLWPPVEAADEIVRQIESGEIPMERLDDALSRIDKMREFRDKALKSQSYDTPNVKFADKRLAEIHSRGISLTRNDNKLIPLSDKYKNFLIVDVSEGKGGVAAESIKAELIKRGLKAEVKTDIYDVPSRVCWQDDIDALGAQYDMVIFCVDTEYENSWGVPFMRIWASHLFDKSKKIIINWSTAFFGTDFFPEDPVFIDMNNAANERTAEAVVKRIFGEEKFEGNPLLVNK